MIRRASILLNGLENLFEEVDECRVIPKKDAM